MDDRPFSLDRLDQLPLYVSKDAYQTFATTNPGMIISSSPLPTERTLVFSGMAGTSSVIPSRLVGSYRPRCTTPLAS